MSKKEKEFSLVELLAAIVILGLLSALAIVGVSNVIKNAEKKHYDSQKNALLMAAQSYTQDNRNSLPKTIGSKTKVTLETLQERKYVGKIETRSKRPCDSATSYVEIFKYSETGYSYNVNLDCPGYEKSSEGDPSDAPIITLSYEDKGTKTPIESEKITQTSFENPEVNIEITGEKALLSYSYIVYDCLKDSCKTELKNSGSVKTAYEDRQTAKINIKDYVPGTIKLVVSATDITGKASSVSTTITVDPKGYPKCGKTTGEGTSWITNAQKGAFREITVQCIDTNGTGCEKEIYSQIFREELETGIIKIKDNSGHITDCEVAVLIDTVLPDKPQIINPYYNKWVNKDYTIKVISNDATSGIAYFEYRYVNSSDAAEREWTKIGNEGDTEFSLNQTKERDVTLEVRICDVAGNCSETSSTVIKIDKTKPTCSLTKSNSGSQSGVSATVKCNDSLSGCPTPSKTYNNIKSSTSYTVKDYAGNESTACSISVSSYSCNPYSYACGSYLCGTSGGYNCACGVYSGTYQCVICYDPIYCPSYCTGYNTCYS